MNKLLASLNISWSNLTDRQKMMIAFETLGPGIDRVGRSGFWAGGRRFIFDEYGELTKVLNYESDGRIGDNAKPVAVSG